MMSPPKETPTSPSSAIGDLGEAAMNMKEEALEGVPKGKKIIHSTGEHARNHRYGLRPEDVEGHKLPLVLAMSSALVSILLYGYGMAKYLILLKKDLDGGARGANVNLRPIRSYSVTCGLASGVMLLFGLIAHKVLKSEKSFPTSSKWTYPILKEWPRGDIYKSIVVLRYSLHYEVWQAIVTVVLVVNFIFGVSTLALIDVPGDPMHLQYIHSGHAHYTKEQPYSEDNPLGLNGRELVFFHRTSLFAMWSLFFHLLIEIAVRAEVPATMFSIPLSLTFDIADAGCFFSITYPRIFDTFGWSGSSLGGYSLYILLAVFRFYRIRRIERFVLCLYAKTGFPFARINGPLVRFWALVLKFAVTIFCMATLIQAAEFPCRPNAVRHKNELEQDACNDFFKDFLHSVYFICVTFSTVGYGDMSPATREGRFLVIFIILFVLASLPGILADLEELADGDDMSATDKTLACLSDASREVKNIKQFLTEAHGAKAPVPSKEDQVSPAEHSTTLNTSTKVAEESLQATLCKLRILKERLSDITFNSMQPSYNPLDQQREQPEENSPDHDQVDLKETMGKLTELSDRLDRLEDRGLGRLVRPPRTRDKAARSSLQRPLEVLNGEASPFYLPSLSHTLGEKRQEIPSLSRSWRAPSADR